ncbi:hypothetical protein ACO0LL_26125 [Undibacterium sp. TC4M20W]|uniref:hypothetical protein n=1 Tax=unclassified Undibacterium TaxID=2630295 RepID=UPI003BF024F7
MNFFKKLSVLGLVLALSACVTTTKVESGTRLIGDKLNLTLEGAWNQVSASGMNGPHRDTWTMEGLPVDKLLVYSGLRDGEPVHPPEESNKDKKVFAFKPGMQNEQIIALFEGALTRDSSTFKLLKMEPSQFGGTKGFHFEFSLLRKLDNLEILGSADVSVVNGQLYAIMYQAPKLVFYPRHIERVKRIVQSARIG